MEQKVIDLNKFKPQFYLVSPLGDVLGKIGVVDKQELKLSLTDIATLNLSVPITSFLAIEKVNDVYQLVEKDHGKLLKYIALNQIEMVDYKGNRERFFIKNKKTSTGAKLNVELECALLPYELSYKTLSIWSYTKFKGNWNPENGYPEGDFVPGTYCSSAFPNFVSVFLTV